MKRKFKGIWIPNYVWLSKDLTLQEKGISSGDRLFDNNGGGGCYASNAYFESSLDFLPLEYLL